MRASTLLWLLVLLAPTAAMAKPAITCHCFTDRSYDPARPAIADPYFLASAQNSFFAEAYGVEKRTVVMKKQRGTSSEDLWVAYEVAARTGMPPDTLLQSRQVKDNWKDVLASQRIDAKKIGSRFAAAIASGATASSLADIVADDLLIRYKLFDPAELAAVRKKGGTTQEAILAALLSRKSRKPALQHFEAVKRGTATWGGQLEQEKIDPKDMQGEFSQLVHGRRR